MLSIEFLKPLLSTPRRRAILSGSSPTALIHPMSGSWPRLVRTEEARETAPSEMSWEISTVPSATEILQDWMPGRRLTARDAFIAQSGQSIPLIPQSNWKMPSNEISIPSESGASTTCGLEGWSFLAGFLFGIAIFGSEIFLDADFFEELPPSSSSR